MPAARLAEGDPAVTAHPDAVLVLGARAGKAVADGVAVRRPRHGREDHRAVPALPDTALHRERLAGGRQQLVRVRLLDEVARRAALEGIQARPAGQEVGTVAAIELIVAGATVERLVVDALV